MSTWGLVSLKLCWICLISMNPTLLFPLYRLGNLFTAILPGSSGAFKVLNTSAFIVHFAALNVKARSLSSTGNTAQCLSVHSLRNPLFRGTWGSAFESPSFQWSAGLNNQPVCVLEWSAS